MSVLYTDMLTAYFIYLISLTYLILVISIVFRVAY